MLNQFHYIRVFPISRFLTILGRASTALVDASSLRDVQEVILCETIFGVFDALVLLDSFLLLVGQGFVLVNAGSLRA